MQLRAEQKLVEQAQKNPEAFGIIFDMYYPKILGYCIRRTSDVAAAEEIVSETFIKALQGLRNFRWRGISIEAWLFRIAINELRMYFRAHHHTISLNDLYLMEGFEPAAEYDLAQEVLEAQERLDRRAQFVRARKIISRLPAKYHDVLILRFAEKKKISEIAEIVHKKEGTVKSLVSRGLVQLRSELLAQPSSVKRVVNGGREDK